MDQLRDKYLKFLILSAVALTASAIAFIFVRYLFAPLLPFLLAYVIAVILRPTVDRACRRCGIPRRVVAFFCVAFVFFTVFSVLGVILIKMAGEIKELSGGLMDGTAELVNHLFDAFEELPLMKELEGQQAGRVKDTVTAMLNSALSSLCAKIPTVIMDIIASMPKILLFSATLILATFYFGADVKRINRFIVRLIPSEKRSRIFEAKEKLLKTGISYARAYLLILTLTFAELLVGFMILRVPYALTLAAFIAIIDILPVLGVGTVLIPWAGVCLLLKNTYLGVGLLILYGLIWVVRQIAEPRIVGKSIGVPPLLTLAAMYTGFSLCGFGGLFLFPIALTVGKTVYEAVRGEE